MGNVHMPTLFDYDEGASQGASHQLQNKGGNPCIANRSGNSIPLVQRVRRTKAPKNGSLVPGSVVFVPDWERRLREVFPGWRYVDRLVRVVGAIRLDGNRAALVEFAEKRFRNPLAGQVGPRRVGRAPPFRLVKSPPAVELRDREVAGLALFLIHLGERDVHRVEAGEHADWIAARVKNKNLGKDLKDKLPSCLGPIGARYGRELRRTYYAFWVHAVGEDHAFRHADWPQGKDQAHGTPWFAWPEWAQFMSRRRTTKSRALVALLTSPLSPGDVRLSSFKDIEGTLFVRLPPTRMMPEGRMVPILVAAHEVRKYLNELERNHQRWLFPDSKDLSRPVRYIGSAILNSKNNGPLAVTPSKLRNTFLAAVLSLDPPPDAFLLACCGTTNLARLDEIRERVELSRNRGEVHVLPSALGLSIGVRRCSECGAHNAFDGNATCAKCGSPLLLDDLSPQGVAKAALMSIVDALWDLHTTQAEAMVIDGIRLLKEVKHG